MQENFVYPAVISPEEDGQLTISFPSLDGAATYVEKGGDIIEAGQELLAMTLIDYLDSHEPLPESNIIPTTAENEKLVYIHVWLPYFRSRTHEVYVKKTLTIPAWLDILARQNDINFSSTLTEALKEKLNIKN